MKTFRILLACILISLPILAFSQKGKNKNKSQKEITTELDSLSYALGVYNASSLKQVDIKEIDIELFTRGFDESFNGKGAIMTPEDAIAFLNNYTGKLRQKQAEENLMLGKKFLDENGKKEGVIVDPSGLQYKIIVQGSGPKPTETDVVKVHYHGTKIDGSVFDSSVERGEPAEFPLNRVIKGWTLGLTFMNVGSKYIFYIPSELAYGSTPRQGSPIKPNEVLIFEVELLGITSSGNY